MLKPLDLLARDHPCTFRKLRTKSKILVNHKDHPCTLLNNLKRLKALQIHFGVWTTFDPFNPI
ncbi:hypothetical protein HanRHA438_Chr13g0601251 [Helianthus annuus]|nr:hypothetical protein HanRHA438_Chr13g0601251 [Helianthus annuus]